ncbi:PEP-CTERM sorting domain-containing protein [Aeoliella sp. SH292]|uniref:PEP-CTERM sorting domain-containing protein n=1 Tax=Aeoliella sp. SH292 TaxID=3454464 RepID=UPI003F97882F
MTSTFVLPTTTQRTRLHARLRNTLAAAAGLVVSMLVVSTASAQATFDSMGRSWTSAAGEGFYEYNATSITLYGAEAADQVVTAPLALTPGTTLSYDYFLSGVGPDNGGMGADASLNFREGMTDAPWPGNLAGPRMLFDGSLNQMDLQDVNNNDYYYIYSLTPSTTGIHVKLYMESETSAQLRIWNGMGEPEGDPVFSSVDTAVAMAFDSAVQSLRLGLWNSPGQYLTFSNLTLTQSEPPTGLAGDFNGDGTVNLADYTVWRDNLGAHESILPVGTSEDESTLIDEGDYATWKAQFGESTTPTGALISPVAVPEPASWMLVCLGCSMGFLAVRKCRTAHTRHGA